MGNNKDVVYPFVNGNGDGNNFSLLINDGYEMREISTDDFKELIGGGEPPVPASSGWELLKSNSMKTWNNIGSTSGSTPILCTDTISVEKDGLYIFQLKFGSWYSIVTPPTIDHAMFEFELKLDSTYVFDRQFTSAAQSNRYINPQVTAQIICRLEAGKTYTLNARAKCTSTYLSPDNGAVFAYEVYKVGD